MMKFIKYGWLAALPMIFTACQEDVLVKEQQQDKIYTLSATMDRGSAMSRAQIQLGNQKAESGETFIWNENDSFDFYQRVNDEWVKSTFTIQNYSEQNPAASATFSTTSGVEAGVVFKAYYPANDLNNGVSHILPDRIGLSDNPAQAWKDYFSTYMFMEASADYLDAENPVVSFRHICSLARITYTNQTGADQAITYFALNGNQEGTFGTGVSGGSPADRCGLEVSGLTVADGESVDLYLLFFPKEFKENGKLQVIMKHPSADEVSTSDISVSLISQANNGASGFEAGKRYWFQVTETTDGLVWTKDVNQGEEDDETTVTFTNKEFAKALEAVLKEGKIWFDKDSCGVMFESDVLEVTSLNFPDRVKISSLAGIERFKNLEALQCSGVGLTSCDLSKNPKIFHLNLAWNNLTSIDLSKHSALQYLYCSFNENLSELKIAEDCYSIHTLSVENTKLESLNIPNPSLIEILYYGNTNIEPFDLTRFDNLKTLDLDNMGLKNLDLIPSNIKAQLEILYVDDNSLSKLDLNEFPMLRDLHCHRNNIEKLDVPASPDLRSLMCTGNKIDSLDISGWGDIGFLECGNQQDTSKPLILTMTESLQDAWVANWGKNSENSNVELFVLNNTITIENPKLALALQKVLGEDIVSLDSNNFGIIARNIVSNIKELNFNEGYIPSLNNGIEFFKNLTKLECRYVDLQTCDLSKNTKLTYVDVQSNQLTSLNLAGCENLEQLFCQSNNNLKTLDLTGCTKLWNFQAHGTALTSLNIPNPSAMDNMLLPAGVGIDNWTNWDTFATTFSNLTGLGLQNKQNVVLKDIPEDLRLRLTYLNVNQTRIEALDLSLFPSLTALDCEWNSIKTLDLKKVPNLQTLHCMGNRIAELDITGLSGLTDLKCGRQGAEDNVLQLTLKLTTEQMTQWAAEWKDNGCNIGVTAEEVTNAGGSSNS